MPVTKQSFGANGIDQYTLINDKKTLAVMLLNYGGTLTHILVPDKTGHIRDVALGFDDFDNYKRAENPYYGALIGRFANRIGEGKFSVDGKEYQLATNNGPNALHGGLEGFDKKLWDVKIVSQDPPTVELDLVSSAGDQGYPGTLHTTVVYTVRNDDSLEIQYRATTTADTVVNLTNHNYFNLAGVSENPKVLETRVQMHDVKGILELDANALPTGKQLSWSEAPQFDFTGSKAGTSIGARFDELKDTNGYDHPYVIHNEYTVDTSKLPLRHAVTAFSPETGIQLDFHTTEPAFQFYTGNFIPDDTFEGKKSQNNAKYGVHGGFCLESSRFPDAPNKPDWLPMSLLKPGETYASKTVFRFGAHE
ncbi:aldose 1-epimerase [Syncephalastrum racemosum]|uniref:Aldose 1-epimerase n=1 Tax=Syncephalastrum racemosum TaxID=13706 RepID=A0A1X2HSR8_SYNRA|nr:aldose 1-epimerase [Syncephalastrum racemosum]